MAPRPTATSLCCTPTWITGLNALTPRPRASSLGCPASQPGPTTYHSDQLHPWTRARCPGCPGRRLATRLRGRHSRTSLSLKAGQPRCAWLPQHGCPRGGSPCTGLRNTPPAMLPWTRGKLPPEGRALQLPPCHLCKFQALHPWQTPPPLIPRRAPPEPHCPCATPTLRARLLAHDLQTVNRRPNQPLFGVTWTSQASSSKGMDLGTQCHLWPARTSQAQRLRGALCLRRTPWLQAASRRRELGRRAAVTPAQSPQVQATVPRLIRRTTTTPLARATMPLVWVPPPARLLAWRLEAAGRMMPTTGFAASPAEGASSARRISAGKAMALVEAPA